MMSRAFVRLNKGRESLDVTEIKVGGRGEKCERGESTRPRRVPDTKGQGTPERAGRCLGWVDFSCVYSRSQTKCHFITKMRVFSMSLKSSELNTLI